MSDKNIRAVPAGSDTAENQKRLCLLQIKRQRRQIILRGTTLVNDASPHRHLIRLRQALHCNGCVRLCLNVISAGYSGMISSISDACCLAPTGNSLKAERSGLLVPFIIFLVCKDGNTLFRPLSRETCAQLPRSRKVLLV